MNAPHSRLTNANRELEAAIAAMTAAYREEMRLEPRRSGSSILPGVQLISANHGDGADTFDIIDAERAAWVAGNLIRIFGLDVELTEHGAVYVTRPK